MELEKSSGIDGERYELRKRRCNGGRRRRRHRWAPAEGTCGADPEPLVDAAGVEAVPAVRHPPQDLPGPVLPEADRAGAHQALRGGELGPAAGLDGGPVEAQSGPGSRSRGGRGEGGDPVDAGPACGGAGAGALDADAEVGGEHDGGDEDEDAHGDGDAVAEPDAGGGGGGGERGRKGIFRHGA